MFMCFVYISISVAEVTFNFMKMPQVSARALECIYYTGILRCQQVLCSVYI